MEKKKGLSYIFYCIFKFFVRLFYPRMEVVGLENLPEEPVVLVGNHTQMNGPIAAELYSPRTRYTWCAGQMMNRKEVPDYAFTDFWSFKPKATHWFYHLLSYLITPLSVCVFNNANTIPVYRDSRILTTFRQSIQRLQEGADLVIFPEQNKKFNNILYDFQEGFLDLAKLYYRKTGRELVFVPLYIAPKLKKMVLGRPIRFRAEAPIAEERQRLKAYLMEEITRLACALPLHTVIPYRNIPKKDYPKNLPLEVYDHETKQG